MAQFFRVIYKSVRSKARLAEIKTKHGVIKTPAFVPVATKGSLKALPPSFTREIGIQAAFVNSYHLVNYPGADLISKAGGIHNFSQLKIPLMSDSGGFQVFSLAGNQKKANLSSNKKPVSVHGEENPLLVKISDDGVVFRSVYDGRLIEFTPEKSMEYQNKIGADIIMSFDECTYYPATYEYTKKAMERTHKWLKRCIKQFELQPNSQALYGIIQGGTFADLRKQSAEFVTKQAVNGIAIGGVSVGETKAEMRKQVSWIADFLPKDKPVHLLGVGQIDDIIDLVKYGIDTFDCVEPTRLARMGILYKIPDFQLLISNQTLKSQKIIFKFGEIDILKKIYTNDLSSVVESCKCYVCLNFTKAYLHHLFKQREILAYTLATYHNLSMMEKLFAEIRKSIAAGKF